MFLQLTTGKTDTNNIWYSGRMSKLHNKFPYNFWVMHLCSKTRTIEIDTYVFLSVRNTNTSDTRIESNDIDSNILTGF